MNDKHWTYIELQRVHYSDNKIMAKMVRDKIKRKFPRLKYSRIFTEQRSGGVCRTKFYNVYGVDTLKVITYVYKTFNKSVVRINITKRGDISLFIKK